MFYKSWLVTAYCLIFSLRRSAFFWPLTKFRSSMYLSRIRIFSTRSRSKDKCASSILYLCSSWEIERSYSYSYRDCFIWSKYCSCSYFCRRFLFDICKLSNSIFALLTINSGWIWFRSALRCLTLKALRFVPCILLSKSGIRIGWYTYECSYTVSYCSRLVSLILVMTPLLVLTYGLAGERPSLAGSWTLNGAFSLDLICPWVALLGGDLTIPSRYGWACIF